MRPITVLLAILLAAGLWAQGLPTGGTALSFSRSVSAPLNAVQFYDAALDAWNWTFGKEPGAKLVQSDRAAGVIEGTARINFRSVMLTGREESTGTIAYAVQLRMNVGECRISVTNLVHTGNSNAPGGGIHLKQLMRVDTDANKVRSIGRSNVVRLHTELRGKAEERMSELMRAFEAHIRARLEP